MGVKASFVRLLKTPEAQNPGEEIPGAAPHTESGRGGSYLRFSNWIQGAGGRA